jgi:hypothetical protein
MWVVSMSRANFDALMDVYYGPSSVAGPPGTMYRTGVPCRVVPQDWVGQDEFPDSLTFAWVTFPGAQLNMATVTHVINGVYQLDYGAADHVIVTSMGLGPLTCLRAESIAHPTQPAYRRVLVCDSAVFPPLPPPPPPPPPPSPPGCSSAAMQTINQPSSGTSTPSSPNQWWHVPPVGIGPTTWLSTTYVLGGGPMPNVYQGPDCAHLTALALVLVHPGCYSVATTPGMDFWVEFLPPVAGPVTWVMTPQNFPC